MIIKTDNQNYFDIAAAIREKNETDEVYKPSEMALAIANIESGGIPCTLTVTTAEGALVEATLGSKKVSATAGADGTAILILEKEGLWTISATLDGETKSTEVLVEHNIEEDLPFVDPILQNNTWEEISEIARSGKASQIWNVGDTKTFMFQTKVCHAQIIGFDHDDVTDPTTYGREKAGITFQLVELPGSAFALNTMEGNKNPYVSSQVHGQLVSWFNNSIDTVVKNFIVTVNKEYEPTYSTTDSSAENLFMLSEPEYRGRKSLGAQNIGLQYAYYAAGNSRKKYTLAGTGGAHWTRSRKKNSTTDFVYIDSDGSYDSYNSKAADCYCPFAFCL